MNHRVPYVFVFDSEISDTTFNEGCLKQIPSVDGDRPYSKSMTNVCDRSVFFTISFFVPDKLFMSRSTYLRNFHEETNSHTERIGRRRFETIRSVFLFIYLWMRHILKALNHFEFNQIVISS